MSPIKCLLSVLDFQNSNLNISIYLAFTFIIPQYILGLWLVDFDSKSISLAPFTSLSNRYFQLSRVSAYSEYFHVEAGVLQGSVLGPVLYFFIFGT